MTYAVRTVSLAALIGACAAASAGAPAAAQQSAIDHCRAMASDAERIACLEEALMSGEGGEEDGGGFRLPSIPFFGGDDDEAGETAPAAPAHVQSAAPEAEQFGAEQVAVRNNESRQLEEEKGPEPALLSSITRAEEDPRGFLVVQLDNGQVWRQTEKVTFLLTPRRALRQGVEITRSGFGGYRMQLSETGREIKVERVR